MRRRFKRHRFALVLLTACALFETGCLKKQAPSVETITELVSQAEKLEEEKDYRLAAATWEKVVEREPNNAYYLYHLGWNYSRLEDYAKAQTYLTKSLQIDPSNGDAMVTLGYVYLRTNRPEKARPLFEAALKRYPNYEDARLGLDEIESRQRLADLEQVRAYKKRAVTEQRDRALEAFKEEKYDQSLEDWKAMLKENPHDSGALYYVGEIYRRQENYQMAEQYLEESVKSNPNNYDALFALGLVYRDMEEWDSAEATFEKLKKESPNYPGVEEALKGLDKAKVGRATQLQQEGKDEEALAILQQILKKDPDSQAALFAIGQIYYHQQKYDLARPLLEKAYRLHPENIDALLYLGYIYLRADEYAKAQEAFESVLVAVPDYTDAEKGLDLVASAEKKKRVPS